MNMYRFGWARRYAKKPRPRTRTGSSEKRVARAASRHQPRYYQIQNHLSVVIDYTRQPGRVSKLRTRPFAGYVSN